MTTLTNYAFMVMLRHIGACPNAKEWAQEHGGNTDELWRDCHRGDWMAWIIAKQSQTEDQRRKLVGTLAKCARLSLKYWTAKYPDDKRVENCLDTCEKYAVGLATRQELEAAANAAGAAAAAAYATADAAAAAAAAYATADAAAAAAAAAADAAAADADAAAARSFILLECANIFRKAYSCGLLDEKE